MNPGDKIKKKEKKSRWRLHEKSWIKLVGKKLELIRES